ncbi:MAG: accessory gene regulator B family protein [Lachnospiraceae bacterium]|nr:accessory gene regulator B family protein [Lachnospiraceae bacterium]
MEITRQIVEHMREKGIIREADYNVYLYGMELLELKVFAAILALAISFMIQTTLFLCALLVFLVPIRKYAGGIHAPSKELCLFFTELILFCAELVWKHLLWTDAFQYVSMLFGVLAVVLVAPVESKKRRLNQIKKTKFRKLSIVIAMINLGCFITAFFFRWEMIKTAASMAMMIEAWLLFPYILLRAVSKMTHSRKE